VPVNPAKKVTPAQQVSTIAASNLPLLAVVLGIVAGYTAAEGLTPVGLALGTAAGVLSRLKR
jgi:hypothetical protein